MRAIILAVIVSASVVGEGERLYRTTGGMPSVVPGMTRIEYQWKMKRTLGRSGVVYVIGDSRVGWGFAERVFNREYEHLGSARGVSAVNAGVPAASIVANMKYILSLQANRQPQAMVVNFSPVGFYQFQNFPGPQIPGLKIQDLLDDRLDSYLAEWLWTRGRPEELTDHFGAYWRTRKIWRAVTWVSRS